jgi:hypothetical protein
MRALVAAAVIAIAGASAMAADRPTFSYGIVVEGPASLEVRLRDELRAGRTCAAVARSVGMRLATSVAVILTSGSGAVAAPIAPAADVRVLTSTPDGVDELARRLDASAAQGFGLCGLTLTRPVWGRPGGEFAVIAVLARSDAAPTGVTYRALHTTGRRGDWGDVQRAAEAGFVVTRVASRPQPEVSSTNDIVYVAEKTAASRPSTYDMVLAGNGPALQKDLDKSIARGFCAQATWANPERMTILLAKPIDGRCDRPHEYTVVESSAFMGLTVSFADGALLGIHRVKDGMLALHDATDRALEYSVAEGVLADEDSRPLRPARELRALVDRLNADGDRGFRPIDVAWRAPAADGPRAVDVILTRPRD